MFLIRSELTDSSQRTTSRRFQTNQERTTPHIKKSTIKLSYVVPHR